MLINMALFSFKAKGGRDIIDIMIIEYNTTKAL